MDLHDMVLPVHVVNCLSLLIKSPLGMFGMSWSPSSEIDPDIWVHGYNSLHWHSRSDVEWSVDMETEFFVESLSLKLFSIFKIDYLPSLVLSIMNLVYNNWLCFSIFITFNIKSLFVLDVNKLVTSVLEDLPPLWVSSGNLNLCWSTIADNVPWLVVNLGLDCQTSLVEPPDLSLFAVSSLNDHVSIVDDLKVSSW
jgi:hypothetical protein